MFQIERHGPTVKRSISLRGKLTLWMVAIFTIIQLSFSLVLQLYHTQSVQRMFNERLATRTTLAADRLRPLLPSVSDETLLTFVREQSQTVPGTDLSMYLYDERGGLIAGSRRPALPITPDVLAATARSPVPVPLMVPGIDIGMGDQPDVPLRGAARFIKGSDDRQYLFVLLSRDVQAQEIVALMRRAILAFIPIGIFAAGISAYLIAGIAIRPYTAIANAAKKLSPESIRTRVEMPTQGSEVQAVREELEQARKRIEAGFAAQERFMSNVSHELKTPIATILTEAQILRADSEPARIRDFVRSLREELEKLAQTIDSFLLLTRVRDGKAKVPASAVCYMRDVLLEAYAASAPFARQYNVRIDLRLPDENDTEVAVIGNCDLLRVIFDNIIRNAIRFSMAESLVTVRCWVEGAVVHTSVRDRGSGIPEELLPRIFDRFSQASEEQRRGRGHGLGLEIALGIAELHGGSITVRNCDDAGCEFVVRLPLSIADAEAPSAPVVRTANASV